MVLHKAFFGAVHDTSKHIDIFINDILRVSVKAQLKVIRVTIDNITIKDDILMNLNESFQDVKMPLLTQPNEPKLITVHSMLTTFGPVVSPETTTVKSEMALSTQMVKLDGKKGDNGCSSNPSSSHGHTNMLESNHMHSNTKKDERGYHWCDPTHDNHCRHTGWPYCCLLHY